MAHNEDGFNSAVLYKPNTKNPTTMASTTILAIPVRDSFAVSTAPMLFAVAVADATVPEELVEDGDGDLLPNVNALLSKSTEMAPLT